MALWLDLNPIMQSKYLYYKNHNYLYVLFCAKTVSSNLVWKSKWYVKNAGNIFCWHWNKLWLSEIWIKLDQLQSFFRMSEVCITWSKHNSQVCGPRYSCYNKCSVYTKKMKNFSQCYCSTAHSALKSPNLTFTGQTRKNLVI